MSSLVQYDSSDSSSESESEIPVTKEQTSKSAESRPVSSLLNSLPAPATQSQSSFPSISALLSKRDKNGKAVISMPVAPDSDSDDESRPPVKKKKLPPSAASSSHVSALLKSLPAPRHQPQLIPSSMFLKKKPDAAPAPSTASVSKPKFAPVMTSSVTREPVKRAAAAAVAASQDEAPVTGESLMGATSYAPPVPDNTRYQEQAADYGAASSSYGSATGPYSTDYSACPAEASTAPADYGVYSAEPSAGLATGPTASSASSASVEDLFSDERFKRLSRGGKHSKQDLAAIAGALVDVDENDRAVSFNSLPSKYMSEEKATRAPQSQQPSRMQKNKHQITYLAFQAKERELELRNQWSENRQSRQQTQSKYGF